MNINPSTFSENWRARLKNFFAFWAAKKAGKKPYLLPAPDFSLFNSPLGPQFGRLATARPGPASRLAAHDFERPPPGSVSTGSSRLARPH